MELLEQRRAWCPEVGAVVLETAEHLHRIRNLRLAQSMRVIEADRDLLARRQPSCGCRRAYHQSNENQLHAVGAGGKFGVAGLAATAASTDAAVAVNAATAASTTACEAGSVAGGSAAS